MATMAKESAAQLDVRSSAVRGGGQLPVKTPSEHCSMAKTSSSLGTTAPHSASKAFANAPATSAIPVTPGDDGSSSVGAFWDAPMPASAPAYAAVKTVLLSGVYGMASLAERNLTRIVHTVVTKVAFLVAHPRGAHSRVAIGEVLAPLARGAEAEGRRREGAGHLVRGAVAATVDVGLEPVLLPVVAVRNSVPTAGDALVLPAVWRDDAERADVGRVRHLGEAPVGRAESAHPDGRDVVVIATDGEVVRLPSDVAEPRPTTEALLADVGDLVVGRGVLADA